MNKDKLIICDLDGTLFDTKKVNYHAYCQALTIAGIKITFDYDEYIKKCWGPTYKYFLPIMGVPKERFEEIHDLKKTCYQDNLKYAKENINLFNMLESLKDKYYLSVVTSGSHNSKDILRFFNRYDLFDAIFTIDDVKNGKPDPEGFFKAMDYFKVLAKNTIIFEDSDVGIKAAKYTGASIFVVNDF